MSQDNDKQPVEREASPHGGRRPSTSGFHRREDDPARATLITAGLLGLLGVAAGAFGAHGLESRVTPEQLEWWQTAARYQQIHALALLLVGWGAGAWSPWRTRAAVGFAAGIVVFSGTLYAMALGGPRVLGAITPLGGLCLIAGWGMIAVHAGVRKS